MWKRKISVFIIALITTGNIFAQEKFDLAILVDRVLTENYQVKIFRNEEIINQNNNTLGNAGFLPQVSIQGTRSETINNTKQKLFNGTVREGTGAKNTNLNGFVRADWTIFDGFGMFARRDQLGILEDMGRTETKYYIEQTISDVATLYFQLIRSRIRLANYQQTLAVSRFRADLEKKKLGVGSSNALLYNQAFIDYNTDSLLVIEQQRTIKSLEIQINRIINRDPDLPVEAIDADLALEALEEKQSLMEAAVANNQQLQLADLNEMLAEANIKIQKSDLYPQVSIFGQYSYSKSTNEIGVTESNRSYGIQYGVTVRFNLFNGRNETREVRNAQIVSQNNSIAKEDVNREVEATVLNLYYQHEALRRQLSIAQANVQAAEKSQLIAREQLEKQAISGYDFRLTQLSVINAYNSVTEIKFNLKSLEVELNRMTGMLSERYL